MKAEQNTLLRPSHIFLKKNGQRESGDPLSTANIFNQAPVGYCILNEKGTFLQINASGLALLKTDWDQLQSKSMSRFIFPEDQDIYYRHREKLLETSRPQTYELRMVTTAGTTIWTMLTVSLVLEADSALRYHFVITDISEHKQQQDAQAGNVLDSRAQTATRTHSVARLAGGVAHSFNNMLGVISGYTEMALQQIAADKPLHADLFAVKQAADRCAELTSQLLAFAGRQSVAPQIIDVNVVIESKVKLLRQMLPSAIRLNRKLGEDIWPVKIDPVQFEQIISHLCENAGEAIADTGTITLQTENRLVDPTSTSGRKGSAFGEYVQITVSDNGCGIAPQILDHVFEPFFTTKKNGSGLGLGLATADEVVKQNGGYINVSSTLGQKTQFKIFLPRYRESKREDLHTSDQGPTAMTAGSSRETILLVDDEPIILDMVTRLLEHRGYSVLKANSAEEALLVSDDFIGNIDLLLTDVVMPGMNGDDLATQLLPKYPALKCLFMSGYAIDVVTARGLFSKGIHFIQKPFGINDVLESIQQVLNGQ